MSIRNIVAIAFLAMVMLTQLHSADVWLSDAAYDFDSSSWLIDHTASVWRSIFYDGPKALLIVLGLILVVISAWRTNPASSLHTRREALFLFLCLAIVPGVTGAIKQNSGVSCPYAIERYGGIVADVFGEARITSYQDRDSITGCWPSGHASGGFALLALAFLRRPRKTKLKLALPGLAAGSAMGIYQILRGAHFASHIAVTLCAAILLISLVSTAFPPSLDRSHDT